MTNWTADQLAQVAPKLRGATVQAGTGAARTRPAARAPRGPSAIEEALALQIRAAGLPAPVREFSHFEDRRFRLDFAWPARKIGVEVQGMVHRIKERFEADIEKRALSLLSGWRVLEVSGAAVKDGRALGWIEQLLKMEN